MSNIDEPALDLAALVEIRRKLIAEGYAEFADPVPMTEGDSWPEEVRALPIRISSATDAKSYAWPLWNKMETWGQALDGPLAHHRAIKEKGHRGITQGEVIGGGRRLAENMKALYAVFIDIESGDREEEVRKKLEDLGWCGLTYSTFSHGKAQTTIKDKDLIDFLRRKDLSDLADEEVRRFLIKERGMRPRVVENIRVEEGEGFERIAHHAPIDRFRVVLPLAEPFILKRHGETATEAGAVWAGFYRGVARTLDVWHDEFLRGHVPVHVATGTPVGNRETLRQRPRWEGAAF